MDGKPRYTPLKAIRMRCLDCSGMCPSEVRNCDRDGIREHWCELWPYRMGHRPEKKPALSALQSIRRYCVDNCMCGQVNEVRLCPQGFDGPGTTCPLYEFRFGHNPNRKGIGNKNASFGRNRPVSSGSGKGQEQMTPEPSGNGQDQESRTQLPIPGSEAEMRHTK
jgi:hypothetical protein